MNRSLFFSVYLLSLFFPLFFSEVSYRNWVSINYIIQLFFFGGTLIASRNPLKMLFSPSALSGFYLLICFIVGNLLFYNDLYLLDNQYEWYQSWEKIRLSSFYYNTTFFVISISYLSASPLQLKSVFSRVTISLFTKNNIIVFFLLFLFFSFFEIGVEFSAGGFSLSLVVVVVLACLFFLKIKLLKSKYKYLFYIFILGLFAALRFENKREAIFLLLPILLIELSSFRGRLISLTNFIRFFSLFLFVFSLIVFMSIKRAEERGADIKASSLVDIVPAMYQYLSNEKIYPVLADNFEINYVFINSHNASELVLKNRELMTWGITYLKPLFLFVDRETFPDKPDNVMTLYTRYVLPYEASRGYCLPLSLQTEALWNFGIVGGNIILFFMFFVFNKIYKSVWYAMQKQEYSLLSVFHLCVYYNLFILCRDSGFEKIIIAIALLYIISSVLYFVKTIKVV